MQTTPQTNQQFLNEMSDEDHEDSEDYVDPRPVAPRLVWGVGKEGRSGG